jgi:hypothetical protein
MLTAECRMGDQILRTLPMIGEFDEVSDTGHAGTPTNVLLIDEHPRRTSARFRSFRSIAQFLFLGAFVISCDRNPQATTLPPPDVDVVDVQRADVPVYGKWVGTLVGYVNADDVSQAHNVPQQRQRDAVDLPTGFTFRHSMLPGRAAVTLLPRFHTRSASSHIFF